tara:strand:- start:37 stop:387 length:351 start_codon:yes stop_codon:yes gene_type:complete
MSKTFYAKCIRCKTEFDQGITNSRLCSNYCKEKRHEESVKRGMDKQIKKRKLESQIIRKCRFCYKEFDGSHGRLYCSATCRTKFWNLPDRIEATEDHIMRLCITLEMLKSKLHGIK